MEKTSAPSSAKRHRPRHGLEEPALHRLQREDRQIRSDDDAARKEDRPLHFVRRVANLLRRVCAVSSLCARWRTMFSIITTEPSTTMPKSSAPSESRLAGMWLRSRQMEANISANGMVSATMMAPRTLPRNRNRMIATRIIALGQIVLHGLHREVHQIGAVEEWNDLHALGQNAVDSACLTSS